MFNRLVDVIRSLLDGPRASDAFVLRIVMASPWALRIEDRAPLALLAVVRGDLAVTFDDGATTTATAGDVVLIRGPEPYVVADRTGRDITAVVDAEGACHTRSGVPLDGHMSLGVRTWGNADDVESGDAVMLLATYTMSGEVGDAVTQALSRVTVVAQDDDPLRLLFETELGREAPGQGAILDRLADLLLVTGLRSWLSQPDTGVPRWLVAPSDPVIGHAVRLLHNNIECAWTVAGLAREVGLSRAAFARRFTEAVGEPPMRHLTRHRLSVAADLLVGTDRTLDSIATDVGYSGAFALSSAFTRERGISPGAHRRVARRSG